MEIAHVAIVKLGFHSNISFVAGETFLSEDQKNKLYPKFLQVISETVVTDDYLPKQVSTEGFGEAAKDLASKLLWPMEPPCGLICF